jgi:hypothetical protein
MEEEKGFNFQRHRKLPTNRWTAAKYIFYLLTLLGLGLWYLNNFNFDFTRKVPAENKITIEKQ